MIDPALLILLEMILLPKGCLGLFILMGEVVLPAGAEVDVPAPEAAQGRFRVPVVVSAELAVLAGVGLFSHIIVFVVQLLSDRRSVSVLV